MKFRITVLFLAFSLLGIAQNDKQGVVLTFKDGKSIDAIHFGQDKCGKEVYGDNYVIIRGKYLDVVTEIKKYKDIEKIVLEGYKEGPATSVGNEKGTLRIYKKNGVSVTLTEAEIAMSCYAPGDKYNTLVVVIMNPLTNKAAEQVFETKDIHSIVFK